LSLALRGSNHVSCEREEFRSAQALASAEAGVFVASGGADQIPDASLGPIKGPGFGDRYALCTTAVAVTTAGASFAVPIPAC
jgi:hypothetical protein